MRVRIVDGPHKGEEGVAIASSALGTVLVQLDSGEEHIYLKSEITPVFQGRHPRKPPTFKQEVR